jgi:hypothetical protein
MPEDFEEIVQPELPIEEPILMTASDALLLSQSEPVEPPVPQTLEDIKPNAKEYFPYTTNAVTLIGGLVKASAKRKETSAKIGFFGNYDEIDSFKTELENVGYKVTVIKRNSPPFSTKGNYSVMVSWG